MGNFVANAVRKAVAAPDDDGFGDLEATISRVHGLLQLLSNNFEHIRVSGETLEGLRRMQFCAGIERLVNDTLNDLHGAFSKAAKATH